MGIHTHGHGPLDGGNSLCIKQPWEKTMPDLTEQKPSQSPWPVAFPTAPGSRIPDSKSHPERASWLVALRCRLRRNAIDRDLAAGADPDSSECRHSRASQLTAESTREALAAELERFQVAATSVYPLDAVPVNWRGIREAGPHLDRLTQRLREDRTAKPQGIARARLLVATRDSALNANDGESRLVDEVRSILAFL
jgi:hypothetical protein